MDFNNFCNSLALPILYRPNFLAFSFDPITNTWTQSIFTKHFDLSLYADINKMIFFRAQTSTLMNPIYNIINWSQPCYLDAKAMVFKKTSPDLIIDLMNKHCPELQRTKFNIPAGYVNEIEKKNLEEKNFTIFGSIDTPPSTDYSWIVEYYNKLDVYAPLFFVLVVMIVLSVKIINSSTPNSAIFNAKHAANNNERIESQKIVSAITLKSKLTKFILNFFKNKYNNKN